FVGPSIEPAARTEESDPDLESVLSGADPLVVVSLGTLHAGGENFFRSCIEAFAPLPASVLLVVGVSTDPAAFEQIPSHIIVRSVVPHLEALRHSAVFVTHG